jgi:hypothetical protein
VHIQALGKINANSKYSNYILDTGHAYGNTTNRMKGVKKVKKENI